ncbi:hypothetical protein IT570_13165 [Candidatus Sumerlaeota bacterium]|nr:hypothetical protein [Candidatus Sumerlaeota bacterium]
MRFFLPLFLLLLGAMPASAGVIFSGTPKPRFFSTIDAAEVTESATVISVTRPRHIAEKDYYLIAVPPGELGIEITAASVRESLTEEIKDVFTDFDETLRQDILADLKGKVALEEFGVFRNLRTAKLVVDRTRSTFRQRKNWELYSYTIRVTYPAYQPVQQTAMDSAMHEGIYRSLLDAIIAVPEAIEPFASTEYAVPSLHARNAGRVPGSGWWRIPITSDGIYLIDGKFLSDSKFDAALERSPGELRIFRKSEAVPIAAIGDGNLPFSQGGRLFFHASGNASPETAEASYFLKVADPDEPPAMIESAPSFAEAPALRRTFPRIYRNEKDEIFQTRMGSFLSVQRMIRVWAEIKPGEATELQFDAPGFSTADAAETTTATLSLYSRADTVVPAANLKLLVNEQEVAAPVVANITQPIELQIPSKLLRETGNTLTIQMSNAPDSKVPALFVDYLELDYTSTMAGKGGSLEIQFPADEKESAARLQLTGLRAQHMVALKLTPTGVQRLTPQAVRGGALVDAEVGPSSRFLFLEDDQIPRAPLAHSTQEAALPATGRADVLVIYHDSLREAAQALLGNLKEAKIEATGVDVQRIYDAYNHGDLSTNAIRDYLSDAVHTWPERRPYAAILLGDANGDGRNVSRQDVPNLIPIHSLAAGGNSQANRISSDSYYSWLSGRDEATDLIISRISTSDPSEAMNAVKNIIAYRADEENAAEWKQRVMLITDTGGFSQAVENLTGAYDEAIPGKVVLSVDEMPWEDNYYLPPGMIARTEDSKVSPAMTTAINDVYARGCGLSLFFGHGAPNLWSNQRFWFGGGTPNSDILRMGANHRLTFVTSFTCNNAVVDYPLRPWNVCIAEDFMRYEGKGAIGCFMPSGPGYITNHEVLADGMLHGWTMGIREHGVLSELARLNHQVRLEPDDHSRMFIELGDPTLKLASPIVGTSQNESSTGQLMIQRIVPIDEPTSATLKGEWAVSLRNKSHGREMGTLDIQIVADDGKRIKQLTTTVRAEGREEIPVRISTTFPEAGLYRIQAELTSQTATKPAPSAELPIVIPGTGEGLALVTDSVVFRAAGSAKGSPRIAYTIANVGNESQQAEVVIRGMSDEKQVFTISRNTGLLAPAQILQAVDTIPVPTLLDRPLTLHFDQVIKDPGGTEVRRRSDSVTLSGAQACDIRVVPETIKVDPPEPFDGGTIFVHGEVENMGSAASDTAALALDNEGDINRMAPLSNLAVHAGVMMEALKPGERRTFVLRWDPNGNAGDRRLSVVIDPGFQNVETNRDNNVATIQIHVRTKTKLASGEIVVGNAVDPKNVQLIAQVSNVGETDSRPVAVTFYNSQLQTDDTKLGEVVVPSIAAGQMMVVPIDVPLTSFSVDRTKFQPSFTIALKGSLMRVSSVSE